MPSTHTLSSIFGVVQKLGLWEQDVVGGVPFDASDLWVTYPFSLSFGDIFVLLNVLGH